MDLIQTEFDIAKLKDDRDKLQETVVDLVRRVDALERDLPKRKSSKPGPANVCRKHPDASTCDEPSLYQHQQGCRGAACVVKNTEYYADRRKDARSTDVP